MAWVNHTITLQDCEQLATRLREEDRKEVLAVAPERTLVQSLVAASAVSYKQYAVMEEGIGCIAVFGVRKVELESGGVLGVPWLLCSEDLFGRSCRKFIRQCKGYVKEMTDDFYYSFNMVSTTNTKAHHWLTWMGFKVDKETTHKVKGVPFHPFSYIRTDNV